MSLTYSLDNSDDLFEKLKYDYSNLNNELNAYTFFNFIITAYHLKQWIEEDELKSETRQQKIKEFKKSSYYNICRDITNASKHFKLNYIPKTQDANLMSGCGVGRCGHGACGIGECSIEIIMIDGRKFDALEVANKVMKIYSDIFEK